MLHFFTDPYKDELIYSAIARYHFYSGTIDFKDTLEECFGKRSIIPSLEFGSPIKILANNLGGKYTTDYIISKHTILPYYSPFISKKRKASILKDIKYSDCGRVHTQIGILAGSVCKKDGIYYCPICSRNELEVYGEAFIHREHQLQGISLCAHHGVTLIKYVKYKKDASRIEFIRLDSDFLDLKVDDRTIDNYEVKLKLAKASYWLLSRDLTGFDKQKALDKYKELLWEKGLTTSSGRVKQNRLYEEFVNFYGKEFLRNLECDIDNEKEYNWLRVITRALSRAVHPIRHLLMINFLVDEVAEFFKKTKENYKPFGGGAWPCLNKVADHYLQNVVVDLEISEDYKSRMPIGTFTCSCGFVYSRKGPDTVYEDRFRLGRIKGFGKVWEAKLKVYLSEGKYGLRELSRLMYCDPKTIIKFDKLLEINYFKESNITLSNNTKIQIVDDKLEVYKAFILKLIEDNPGILRTKIRALCKKEYTYIYKEDKAWLFDNLPKSKKVAKPNIKVSWEERDNEILKLVQAKYQELIALESPVRITKSLIGKKIERLAELEKRMYKLPNTEVYLKQICETTEEFQLRRCKGIIEKKLQDNTNIRLWEVQKLAAIRKKQFENIKPELQRYIEEWGKDG